LTLNADGSFTYTPDTGFSGEDTFTYQVSDGEADGNLATVKISVDQVNAAPEAADDSLSVVSGNTLNVDAPGILANGATLPTPASRAPTRSPTWPMTARGTAMKRR
jgi:hypothetical protein